MKNIKIKTLIIVMSIGVSAFASTFPCPPNCIDTNAIETIEEEIAAPKITCWNHFVS